MDSEPYMKIYGNGDATLTINDKTIKFNDIDRYIEIDTELMNCFKDNINQNNRMIGEFPVLKSGENSVTWSGDITKIEIEPRWVRL